MLSTERKPVSGEKNLSTLGRCALICKWACRQAGLRGLANLALIGVLVDLSFHIQNRFLGALIVLACGLLILRPAKYLLFAFILVAIIGRSESPTESQGGKSPDDADQRESINRR